MADAPDPDGLVDLLVRAGRAAARARQRETARHGLTPTALAVLQELSGSGSRSHRDLAARLGITPATLTPVVDGLADGGDVRRERGPQDRRVVTLTVTDRGRARAASAAESSARSLQEALPGLAPAEDAVVRAYLRAVLTAVADGA